MELDKAIQKRHSVRKFKDKKPNWRTIIECIDAARYAPMAGNINTSKFILVDDETKIQNIAKASQQPFVAQAQFLVVACSVPSRTENTYGEKGKAWVKQQTGAALQNFLLMIEEAGLSTCWVGLFDEATIRTELFIPDGTEIEAIFPIGYEYSKPTTKKTKIDLDRILYFNKYGNMHMRKDKKAYT